LQSLTDNIAGLRCDTGYVCAWPVQTADQSRSHWIAHAHKHNGDCAGCELSGGLLTAVQPVDYSGSTGHRPSSPEVSVHAAGRAALSIAARDRPTGSKGGGDPEPIGAPLGETASPRDYRLLAAGSQAGGLRAVAIPSARTTLAHSETLCDIEARSTTFAPLPLSPPSCTDTEFAEQQLLCGSAEDLCLRSGATR
jgi:hypothetical protein